LPNGFFLLDLVTISISINLLRSSRLLLHNYSSPTQKKQPLPNQTGLRIANLRDKIPTIDRIVLVPDQATFLAAIEHWSLEGRWPILIEDEQYTPMFIRRFHPDQVIRLPSVATPLPKGEEFSACKELQLWHGIQLGNHHRRGSALWRPPGVVVTRVDDPAWPAAIALATDRGQPLAFLDADFGSPMEPSILINGSFLRRAFNRRWNRPVMLYESLGDDIDTVTHCPAVGINIPKMLRKYWQLTV